MKDSNCIFCKLANGEIPTNSIYEDEEFNVILDNGPATKGHCLILPKDHYANLFELPDDVATEAIKTVKKVATQMKNQLKCDGLNLVQNNGECAGQTVFHYHMHIIPRYQNDGQTIGWKPGEPSQEELEQIREEIVGA